MTTVLATSFTPAEVAGGLTLRIDGADHTYAASVSPTIGMRALDYASLINTMPASGIKIAAVDMDGMVYVAMFGSSLEIRSGASLVRAAETVVVSYAPPEPVDVTTVKSTSALAGVILGLMLPTV